MGHRANFIVIDHQQLSIRYAQFGATTIPADLLAGPGAMLQYIESLEPRDELLDTVWSEGAVLLDQAQGQLLFFEDTGNHHFHESPGLRRQYLPLLARYWPDWTLRWAEAGSLDMVAYLGWDPAPYQAELRIKTPSLEEIEASLQFVSYMFDIGLPFAEYRREYQEKRDLTDPYLETLLTVRWSDKRVGDYSLSRPNVDLLSLGPDLLEVLEPLEPTSCPNELLVGEGGFIDLPRQTISIWWGRVTDHRYLQILQDFWPGWDIRRQIEGLPYQIELSGRQADGVYLEPSILFKQIAQMFGFTENRLNLKDYVTELSARGATSLYVNPTTLYNNQPVFNRSAVQEAILQMMAALINRD